MYTPRRFWDELVAWTYKYGKYNIPLVDFLLSKGADINKKGHFKMNLLETFLKMKSDERPIENIDAIIDSLRCKGAKEN